MAQVQLDDLTFCRAQPGKGGANRGAQLRAPIVGTDITDVSGHLGHLIVGRRDVGRQPAMALIAGHGKQPHPQAVGLAQPRDLG